MSVSVLFSFCVQWFPFTSGVVLGFSPEKQSMKELEHQYQELKKENFELKLRLYYLQEQLKRQTGREGNVSEQEIKLVSMYCTCATLWMSGNASCKY